MEVALHSSFLSLRAFSKGAELQSVKSRDGHEFLWQGDASVWPRRAPVLFPIVGKLNNQSFRFNNREYAMNQHGFARDFETELILQTKNELFFELCSGSLTRACYPFDFKLQLGYRLKENVITCFYSVMNTGKTEMYFSLGAHPGFNIPHSTNEGPVQSYIQFERSQLQLERLENGLLSGQSDTLLLNAGYLQIRPDLFEKDALVFEGQQIEKISLIFYDQSRRIDLECKGWPNFGIWSKPDPLENSLRFVCLEPWYGIADSAFSKGDLKSKKGIICLMPKKQFDCSYTLSFS